MEPVLFYGVPHGCSFGSIVALEWLGEPYRLCRIDMLDTRDPRYARINPLRETPALRLPSGEVLSESLAILHHLAARDPARGLGFVQGSAEFDRLNQLLAFLVSGFHPAWGPIFQPAKYVDDAAAEASVRAKAIARAARGYARIEALLGDGPWLMGARRSIADAYLCGVARWGEDLGVFELRRDYPRLCDLLQRLAADPAVRFAHAIEEGEPATGSGAFRGHVALDALLPRLAA